MRLIVVIMLCCCIFSINPLRAETFASITSNTPSMTLKAYKGTYNGNACLILLISQGKVPVNAPAKRLQLLSGETNNYKNFNLVQIAPGKYVTVNPIVLEESTFKLRLMDSDNISDFDISFQTKKTTTASN